MVFNSCDTEMEGGRCEGCVREDLSPAFQCRASLPKGKSELLQSIEQEQRQRCKICLTGVFKREITL